MTKEISTDAELMSRLLTTQPTPAECLVAAARIEQLAAWLTAVEAERDALRAELELRDRKDAITDDEIALKDGLIAELQGELMRARAALTTEADNDRQA